MSYTSVYPNLKQYTALWISNNKYNLSLDNTDSTTSTQTQHSETEQERTRWDPKYGQLFLIRTKSEEQC